MRLKIFAALAVCVLSLSAAPKTPQSPLTLKLSADSELIGRAMQGILVEAKQGYQLRLNGTDRTFGSGDEPWFSLLPVYGVATSEGIVFPAKARSPWEEDPDFEEYRDEYTPEIIHTEISCDGIGSEILDGNSPFSDFTDLPGGLVMATGYEGSCRLQPDTVGGQKDGWLVWFGAFGKGGKGKPVIKTVRKALEVKPGGASLEFEAPDMETAPVAAVYVTPGAGDPGELRFLVSGIMIPRDGKWVMEFPFVAPVDEVAAQDEASQVVETRGEGDIEEEGDVQEEDAQEESAQEEAPQEDSTQEAPQVSLPPILGRQIKGIESRSKIMQPNSKKLVK